MKFIDYDTILCGEYLGVLEPIFYISKSFTNSKFPRGFQYFINEPQPYCLFQIDSNSFLKNFGNDFKIPNKKFWLQEFRRALKEFQKAS
jgi:hypothetical protein